MRLITAIVLINFLTHCTSSTNYCGSDKNYSVSEIEKFPVYSDVATVKLGSFKLDPSTNLDHLPLDDGNVDVEKFFEIKELSKSDQLAVIKTLVNFDFLPDSSIKKTVTFCYNPRNAILLYDKKEVVIGYVELCFECYGYRTQPQSLKVGEFCDHKFDVLKEFFRKNGIQYGISDTAENDELEMLTKQLQQYPDNSIILTAIAKIKIDNADFSEAIKMLDRAVSADSSNRHAYFYRGHSRLKVKDFTGSKDDFDRALQLSPGMTQAYNERALAMISIFESTRNSELLRDICKDLSTVQSLGDSSVVDLYAKYCMDN